MKEIEIQYINRRYESLRLKDPYREKLLYMSIAEEGIRDPVQGIMHNENSIILIDGYKRIRCLIKMGIYIVPFVTIGATEAEGLLNIIRLSNANKLTTLEEAVIIDELNQKLGLAVSDIAKRVERSNAWVSVRLGIVNEMSECVKESLLRGEFPMRSYMYTLQHFTRVNSIPQAEVEKFVKAVSAKGYSTRDIELFAYGYFRGGNELKEQILNGNLDWTLKRMKKLNESSISASAEYNEAERNILKDFELVQKYMNRIIVRLPEQKANSNGFQANACLLIEGILSSIDNFKDIVKVFYDRKRYTANSKNAL